MNNTWVKRLVTFAILMESGDGIVGKSPEYILEKWNLAKDIEEELLTQLLDMRNKEKYERYLKRWIE